MTDKNQSRREFVATAAGAAALTAAFGFNRVTEAAHHESITQIVTFGLQEGKEEGGAEVLKKLTKAVEENEPDVLVYLAHFTEDSKVVFFEVYKNAAALANHGTQPHMAVMRTEFGKYFSMPFDVKKVKRVGGYMRGK